MRRNIFIGNIYDSNSYGKFKIIDEGYKIGDEIAYKIQFLETGYITITSRSAIIGGRVKDKYKPIVAGVGYIGDIDGLITDKKYFMYYKDWNDMMHRCYNINDNDYSHYGAVGIKVDSSWFCFNTYYNDVQKLPNHDLKLKYPSMYQLDKDYLQLNIPKSQRIYSKETCIWLSKHDNTLIATYERDITNGRYNIPNRYSE